jgi:hypothetical protein
LAFLARPTVLLARALPGSFTLGRRLVVGTSVVVLVVVIVVVAVVVVVVVVFVVVAVAAVVVDLTALADAGE